jgi:hypothetical protein
VAEQIRPVSPEDALAWRRQTGRIVKHWPASAQHGHFYRVAWPAGNSILEQSELEVVPNP